LSRLQICGLALILAAQVGGAQSLKGRRPILRPVQPAGVAERLPARAHYVLEFRSYPGVEVRAELQRRGMRVVGYVPETGLMVSTPGPADLRGLDLAGAGTLDPQSKISPALESGSAAAYLVVFHPDADIVWARNLVRAAGFDILENASLLPGQLLVTGSPAGLSQLAADDEVAYIMPASADLIAGNPVIACGGAITEAGPIGEYVTVGRGWPKDAKGAVALGYFFQSLTPKLDESVVRGEIERAFREWQKYGNVMLAPVTKADASRSISILFASRAHGDAYPFDGPGGVLAHTFYPAPPNSEPLAGDMHLDADEDWHAGTTVDLFSVALHEAGHALGLGHSDRPGSVMYPYYHLATGLTADDIAGIQDLYGVASSTPPSTPPAPTPPTTPTPPSNPTPAPTPTPPTTPTPPSSPPATPDTAPPSLRIVMPSGSILSTSAASIAVSGTASDDRAVASVKWSTSNGDTGTASGTTAWSATVPLLVGNTVITVRAYDAAGNSAWRAFTVVRH
jgi:hypothetical protein